MVHHPLQRSGFQHIPADLAEIALFTSPNVTVPGRLVNPGLWGSLDDGFITTTPGTRTVWYGPDGTFDPTVLVLDTLTEDVESVWIPVQVWTGNVDAPTRFKGPVTLISGELDRFACNGCDPVAFKEAQKLFFPVADFNVVG